MVSKKQIEFVFNNLFNRIVTKCPTIAEMHTILSSMTDDEKFKELRNQNLLNPLELLDYQDSVRMRGLFQEELIKVQNGSGDEYSINNHLKHIAEYEEKLFQYERRLIEGMKPLNPVPVIDYDRFNSDDQFSPNGNALNTELGMLESKQIEAQKNALDLHDVYFTGDDGIPRYNPTETGMSVKSMDNYFGGDCSHINYSISHEKYLNKLSEEQRKEVKLIDKLMDKSTGLLQDTILYRGGHFDIHLRPGDHSSFKGYMSTTFQEATARTYYEDDDTDINQMNIVIHAPKGTKGIVGNDDTFYNGFNEHEYVLPRNTGFTVLSVDYDENVVEIVLDE